MGNTTLLTNLANYVQPLIRYDLGDRVVLHDQRCACGSALPLIEVEGRGDDSLRLAAPGGRAVRVPPLALSTVLEDEAGLYDFQLVQQSASELLLCTGLRGAEGEAALRRGRQVLAAFLAKQGVPKVRIKCRVGEVGPPERSGKLRRVVALADTGRSCPSA
jgi:phenylacetate-coenzyme A ligase PaaK-like adenylate-forming protein